MCGERKQQSADFTEDAPRDLFEAFFASAPVGKAVLDRDGRFMRVNEAFAATNGLAAGLHVGRHAREVLGEEIWAAARPAFDAVVATGEPQQLELCGSTLGPDGETRIWLESLFPIRSGAGDDVIGVGALLLDVSAHRGAETRLRELNDRLQEFVSVASHEIRAPLTAVYGDARLLSRMMRNAEVALPPRMRESVEMLASEAERLRRVVDLFLDLALVDSGHFSAERSPVDLRELLDELVRDFRRRYPAATLLLERGSDPVPAFTSADAVAQIVANLVDNAVKYAGEQPTVTILAGYEGEYGVVRIRDGGPGIRPDVRERVFERYYRGPGHDHQHGLGIGLYISKQMAQGLGGDLTIGAPAAGAEFILTLPLAAP